MCALILGLIGVSRAFTLSPTLTNFKRGSSISQSALRTLEPLTEFDLALGARILKVGEKGLKTTKLGLCTGLADVLAMQALRNGAKRDRLDNNTFKLLSFGFMIDSTLSLLTQAPLLANADAYLSIPQVVKLLGEILVAQVSFSVVQSKGLPDLARAKLHISNPLTILYLVAVVETGALAIKRIGSPIMPFVFLALNGAAASGDHRLSHQTYRTLNLTAVMYALQAGLWLLRGSTAVGAYLMLRKIGIAAALTGALWGLFRGVTYKG